MICAQATRDRSMLPKSPLIGKIGTRSLQTVAVAENPVFRELTFLTANTVMRHAAPFVSIARVRKAEVHVGHAAILFVWNERHC
jgi:hypothetical protein